MSDWVNEYFQTYDNLPRERWRDHRMLESAAAQHIAQLKAEQEQKVSKFKFEERDFWRDGTKQPNDFDIDCSTAVRRANEALEKHLRGCKVVYGSTSEGIMWMPEDLRGYGDKNAQTHRAYLFQVEEIEKKPHEHKPKTCKFDEYFFEYFCECGVKLKAVWSEE